MRIAEIAPVDVPIAPPIRGGIEFVVSMLADGLCQRGHDVTLFSAKGSRSPARIVTPVERSDELEDVGVDVKYELVHALRAYLAEGEFDVIHDHTALGPALGAARGGKPPVVHTLHDPWTDANRRFYEAISPPVHLIAVSQAQADDNPAFDYAGEVYNGVDLDAHPWRQDKGRFVVFLGRCTPEKGPELAVEAAKRADLPLVMMMKRSEPPELAHWEQHVEPRLRGDETLMFDVAHDQKVEILGKAQATLFTSQWHEPLGLVMLESMACGTPVVAISRGSAREVVVDGETGFLVDDLDGMVAALQSVNGISPSACRDRVNEHFSAAAMVKGTERVLEEVVANHTR